MPPHAPMTSDAVALTLPPLARVAVSFHLAAGQQPAAFHGYAAARAAGARRSGQRYRSDRGEGSARRFLVSGVDVESARTQRSVVTFGDSITDGVRATVDSDLRWPDQLAARLQKAG
jgi:lysophospholipase L1-like esterase